jgi:hypothetical protein
MMPTAFAEDHLDPGVSARALDGGQVPSAAPVPSTRCSCTRTRAASLCSWGRWSACYQRGGPRLGERVLVGGAVRLSGLSQNQFGLPGTGGDACCSVPGRAAHVAASEPAPALNGRFRKMREFCGDLSCSGADVLGIVATGAQTNSLILLQPTLSRRHLGSSSTSTGSSILS